MTRFLRLPRISREKGTKLRVLLILTALFVGQNIIAGEFSKIDIVVRETLEREYSHQNIDFFEDISELQIVENTPACDLVVSAKVQLA